MNVLLPPFLGDHGSSESSNEVQVSLCYHPAYDIDDYGLYKKPPLQLSIHVSAAAVSQST